MRRKKERSPTRAERSPDSFFCPSSHTPISAYVVTYPSKTADGEKGRPLVLPLLLYSLVELFLIPVYHAFKKSSRFRFEHRED